VTDARATPPTVAVLAAAAVSALDARGIAANRPSRALMQRAGAALAALLAEQFADRLATGVVVATGSGNNGGDGWVAAAAMHAVGIRVRVVECVTARAPDAIAERASALAAGVMSSSEVASLLSGGEGIVVDALLGTGFVADTPLRGAIAEAIACLHTLRERGARVVAVDVPSGLDATRGTAGESVPADLTVTFAALRRGQLVARGQCGRIVVTDIGLGADLDGAAARLVDARWFGATLPPIPADAHKGTRGKIAIVGGGPDMGGAVLLAARGALRSGAGMVKCVMAPESLATVREGEAAALTAEWPGDVATMREVVGGWADVVLVGPGLGRAGARAMVERVLAGFDGPVVLDADALGAFTADADGLRERLGGRVALLTPHPVEFARLAGTDVEAVLADRFEVPASLARSTGATVLLKGVPTVIADPAGTVYCVAEVTPVLATGGAGDLLGGMAATLLAQVGNAMNAGSLAAFAHGRAARLVGERQVRGFTLDDVVAALPDAWSTETAVPRPPVLADLPPVGEGFA
jgi:hydroxyethylthiazole kinase-like uncharacterized protein yjeF